MKYNVKRSVIQLLKIGLITGIVYLAICYLLKLVFPFLIAYGIAVLYNPLVTKLQNKWKVKRGIISAPLVVLTFFLIGGLIAGAIYALVMQAGKFAENYGDYSIKGTQMWDSCCCRIEEICGWKAGHINTYVTSSFPGIWKNCKTKVLPRIMNYSINSAKAFLVGFSIFIIIMVSTIFILSDYPNIRRSFLNRPIGKLTYQIGRNMKYAGGTYLKAQVIILLVISTICCIGLMLTKNPYAILVGGCIGLCDALPFFGTGTVFIPWLLIKIIGGHYALAATYGIIYLICNFTREFMEPKLIGNKLAIHPMAVLMSTYIGLCVFGVWGFFLGPFAALLIAEIYKVTEEDKS